MKKVLRNWRISTFFPCGLLLAFNCPFDNEETLFKDVVCAEINEPVSYSGFVKPLLEKL